ncbi:cysteine-rich CWC family protein [Vibrio agarivorans]|uniref:cysteine-rich CWC family protein n=1 Tax=Vibrio agarivorans TaxID=153622 RepID=UPI00338F8B52
MAQPTATKRCPLCNQPNQCGQPADSNQPCWCFNKDVQFPKGLLDSVPEEKKGKACICKQCADDYAQKNAIIHRS